MLLAVIGVVLIVVGIANAGFRELAIVVGMFFLFLAGGVLNWDRRGGH
jgi:hypothetical membrane protein